MTSPYTAVNEVRTTLRDDLIAAKALIDTPEKWRKGENAYWYEPFCVLGACREVSYDRGGLPDMQGMRKALRLALPPEYRNDEIFDYPTTRFNDDPDTTHADVMALFDRAIASAESSS